jgi:hypothetical protein
MLAATYDPNNVNGDAFDMDNMVETTTAKILTSTERTDISNSKIHQTQSMQTLTDDASIAWNMANGGFAIVTIAGARTLANPSNVVAGSTYHLIVKQDATGSRTLAFGSYYKFSGDVAPILTATASAVDIFEFLVESTTAIHCTNIIYNSK